MVTISGSTKLWAFHMAEQFEKRNQFDALFTTFAYSKNTFWRNFIKRVDKEQVPVKKIHTNVKLAIPMKLKPEQAHIWNNYFDKWVARNLHKTKSKVFIGWSGMSLHSLRTAKKLGMITVLERGSSHIEFQDQILHEEYEKFGINYHIESAVIEKELLEYAEADFITIPSHFVRNSFLAKGFSQEKLFMNPFGAPDSFRPNTEPDRKEKSKFIIVYLGTLSIRKGLIYLFQALHKLEIPKDKCEVWFIGSVNSELQPVISKYQQENWKFMGHINHYELQQYLSQCDVGIQSSVEEGLSMVIPQLMSCGVPMIVTPNSGGENVVVNNENGFIVPIRNPDIIAEKINFLYNNPHKLSAMKVLAAQISEKGFTWHEYGERYSQFIHSII